MAACRLRGFKSDLVKDLYIVQSVTKSSQSKNNNKKPKTNPHKQTKHSNPKQNSQTEAWQVPVHGLIEARVITLYHLDMVWQQKQKRRKSKSQGHTRRWAKQQKHHAETRDPPSQDPRDHVAQAVRLTYSHFEANNDEAVSQREWWKERWNGQRHELMRNDEGRVRSVVLFQSSYSWIVA